MILVSACLLGKNCKYSGGNNKNSLIITALKGKRIIPVCPEELGGLPTPRVPSEIIGGTGDDVLEGKAEVRSNTGENLTKLFIRGADIVKEKIENNRVALAVLKERSPSCGVNRIYDGTFSGQTTAGIGVCTALLLRSGVKVISEETPSLEKIITDND